MDFHGDPRDGDGRPPGPVESCVAREHWETILTQAALQGLFLISLTLLMGIPSRQGLSLIHLLSLASAFLQGILALKLHGVGQDRVAVSVACRAMAALILAGGALLLVPFAD